MCWHLTIINKTNSAKGFAKHNFLNSFSEPFCMYPLIWCMFDNKLVYTVTWEGVKTTYFKKQLLELETYMCLVVGAFIKLWSLYDFTVFFIYFNNPDQCYVYRFFWESYKSSDILDAYSNLSYINHNLSTFLIM